MPSPRAAPGARRTIGRRNSGCQRHRPAKGSICQVVEEELKPCSERVNSLKSRDNETVFNAAFLVDKERAKAFEAPSTGWEPARANPEVRYAGPLPCYSFVNLHVMIVELRPSMRLGGTRSREQTTSLDKQASGSLHRNVTRTEIPSTRRPTPGLKTAASYRLLLGLWKPSGRFLSGNFPDARESGQDHARDLQGAASGLSIGRTLQIRCPTLEVSMRQSW